jgi:hypothetical protein
MAVVTIAAISTTAELTASSPAANGAANTITKLAAVTVRTTAITVTIAAIAISADQTLQHKS